MVTGTAKVTGLGDEGRTFLTGFGLFGSSNPSETLLIDNLELECLGDCIESIPCPQLIRFDVERCVPECGLPD